MADSLNGTIVLLIVPEGIEIRPVSVLQTC